MIEKNTRVEAARFVEGDLGVHFVYTAGLAGEEFLRALAKGKILAGTCDRCSTTYCPPRLFCEDCFVEVTDRHEVAPAGEIVTLTRLEVDAGGAPAAPQWVAAIRLDGADTTLLHRVEGEDLAIGDRVEVVWAPKREGSILDIRHFRREVVAGAKVRPTDGNGRRKAAATPRARARRT